MSRSISDSTLPFESSSRWAVLFLLLTIPLLFGATHPFMQGLYTFYLLVGAGGWWLFVGVNSPLKVSRRRRSSSPSAAASGGKVSGRQVNLFLLAPWLLLLYVGFTVIPLPLGLLHWLSPERARNLAAVNSLAGAGIGFAPLSYSAFLTFKQGLFYLSLLLYFFSLRKLLLRDRRFFMQVVTVMVGIAFFEALYGLLQFMNSNLGVLWLPSSLGAAGVARGTIIYRNQYATLLNMCWPLALAVAARNRKDRPPVLFFFAAGMIILAVLFSLSRGGIIALFCGALIVGVKMPFPRRTRAAALIGLVVFLAVYGALLGGYGGLLQRFADFRNGVGDRFSVWCMSLPMLFDHPLTGIGLESYVKLSPLYIKHGSADLLWDRAHNEFLELAIELGWPAMLLFCTFLVGGLTVLARNLRRRKEALVALAAFAGIISFFIHGLVDFGWHLPANCVYCVTLLGLLVVELEKPKRLRVPDGVI